METLRRAIIDVGTNSVKLLVADVCGGNVQPVLEDSRQTRLGKGFYDTHRLQPEPVARTADAVRDFAVIARKLSASSIRVIATSAARDAVNPGDLTDAIERVCGLKTEIISGGQEANWVFQGVSTDADLEKHPLLLLDVGGGSTEFILGLGVNAFFARSFPIGTVRLMEKFPPSDPPTVKEQNDCRGWVQNILRCEVRPQLAPALRGISGKPLLIGTGGTASILARIENRLDRHIRERIEGTVLGATQVASHSEILWNLPLARRKEIPGLPKLRADVILTGVLIYEAVMMEFGFTELRVSTRGLRFAAVMA